MNLQAVQDIAIIQNIITLVKIVDIQSQLQV